MTRTLASPVERQRTTALLSEAVTAHGRGEFDRALGLYQQVLAVDGLNADALNLSGLARIQQGDFVGAAGLLMRAVVADPGFAEALNHFALVLLRTGQAVPALRILLRALAVNPAFVEAHANCGGALFELGQWGQAVGCYDRVLAIRPDHAEAHANRANALQLAGALDEARPGYRRTIVFRPDLAEAHSNLASLDQAEGNLVDAIDRFRRALALRKAAWLHSNLLFCLSYDGRLSSDAFFAEFRRWEEAYAVPAYPASPPGPVDPDPDRRLRVGWISADFRDHPVARNVVGILERRDRSRHETFLYASVRAADAMTDRFRAVADHWREALGTPDAEVARQMRADRLDILIVLAGHTGHNRIGVAAHRPAPIQISFHDLATSGLAAMDAWITDPVLHPANTSERFTESLVRVPCFYLHEVPDAPAPAPPPMLRTGYVTFGSCNNTSKHTPDVLALWAEVLKAVPNSRLLLKYLNRYSSARLRRRVSDSFAACGVDPARLIFRTGEVGRHEQLAMLADIDIALDPFPFNGSTTTFEALWMGVPVVSLAGERFLGRVGASLLHQAELDDLVAPDAAGYVVAAADLAGDVDRLKALRSGLRDRLAASPLCDPAAYSRAFEAALRRLWTERCSRA